MGSTRHENNMPGSNIKAVITYTGENIGNRGAYLIIQTQDWSTIEVPGDQAAEFLNKETDSWWETEYRHSIENVNAILVIDLRNEEKNGR